MCGAILNIYGILMNKLSLPTLSSLLSVVIVHYLCYNYNANFLWSRLVTLFYLEDQFLELRHS
jgi:hypothetical protein